MGISKSDCMDMSHETDSRTMYGLMNGENQHLISKSSIYQKWIYKNLYFWVPCKRHFSWI